MLPEEEEAISVRVNEVAFVVVVDMSDFVRKASDGPSIRQIRNVACVSPVRTMSCEVGLCTGST